MKKLFDWIMFRRARALTERLRDYLPRGLRVADIGSGSGHNAACWRSVLGVQVDEFDVADLHWVGAGPRMWDGARLPADAAEYDVATLLFVLQYTSHPAALLQQVRRVCSGRVLILQSTYFGSWGSLVLTCREVIWGRLAFYAARLGRVIRPQVCPLVPQRRFTREELRQIFDCCGYRVVSWEPDEWCGMKVSRDLYVLEAIVTPRPCHSSSRPETKSAVLSEH